MISVLVPIYNTEIYLSQCIDSILNSTYDDFELLLVNDGSKDKSLEICKRYCEKDCRIRVIDQAHMGVSAARNRGIEECRGEWIVFVDSDDFISADFLEMIAQEKYRCCDLLIYDFQRLKKKTKKASSREKNDSMPFSYNQKDRQQLVEHFLNGTKLNENGNMSLLSLWAKTYKKSVLEKYSIRFSEELVLGEDRIFNLKYLLHVESCTYIRKKVYFAELRPDSAMHKYDPRFLYNDFTYQKLLKDILNKDGIFPLVKTAYYNSVLSCMADVLIKGVFHPYSNRNWYENCMLCDMMHRFRLYKQALRYNRRTGVMPRRILLFFFRIRCYRIVMQVSKASYKILAMAEEL